MGVASAARLWRLEEQRRRNARFFIHLRRRGRLTKLLSPADK